MNFLTHLYLSDDTPESRIGNLLPDLCKPWQWQKLSPAIQAGCLNHRKVDRLTDSHPEFMALKSTLSPERRRFAGIILDVSFDHFMARHWQDWHPQPLAGFTRSTYAHFLSPPEALPGRAGPVLQRMAEQDWLSGYEQIEGIARAFYGLSQRFRYDNPLQGSEEELLANEARWRDAFFVILKDLDQARQTRNPSF